jgi:trehalose 2-sulfotransferase
LLGIRSHSWKIRSSHASIGLPKLTVRVATPLAGPPVWGLGGASYVICTSPRSGSWLLSDALSALGVAGYPREWFNPIEEQARAARWRMRHHSDLGLTRYLHLARARSTSRNGVSGLKLHYYQFARLPEMMAIYPQLRGMDSGQILRLLFPGAKYIWLTRRDKILQAISFDLATKTDRWWTLDGSAQTASANAEPSYDAAAIDRMATIFARSDERWQAFFERSTIVPLTLVYEDFAAAYEPGMRRVLDWIGVPGAETIAIPTPRLQRQASARSEQWAERFRAERSGLSFEQDVYDPQPVLARLLFHRIPPLWREWIAQSRNRGILPGEIAAVLMRHGYAIDEIREALHDP